MIALKELEARNVAVRIGDHNIVEFGETGLEKFMNVHKINFHKHWDRNIIGSRVSNHWNYDIAILELEEDIRLDVYTPACVAKDTDGTTFDGKVITLAGWGFLNEYEFTQNVPPVTTNVPYEVNVTVTQNCQDNTRPNNMCVGEYEDGKGSCRVRH